MAVDCKLHFSGSEKKATHICSARPSVIPSLPSLTDRYSELSTANIFVSCLKYRDSRHRQCYWTCRSRNWPGAVRLMVTWLCHMSQDARARRLKRSICTVPVLTLCTTTNKTDFPISSKSHICNKNSVPEFDHILPSGVLSLAPIRSVLLPREFLSL